MSTTKLALKVEELEEELVGLKSKSKRDDKAYRDTKLKLRAARQAYREARNPADAATPAAIEASVKAG